jgi:hypothetical protein
MNEKARGQWHRMRSRGQRVFVAIFGLLFWPALMFFGAFVGNLATRRPLTRQLDFSYYLFTALFGMGFAIYLWRKNEREFGASSRAGGPSSAAT